VFVVAFEWLLWSLVRLFGGWVGAVRRLLLVWWRAPELEEVVCGGDELPFGSACL
jgi:hypothetical protein